MIPIDCSAENVSIEPVHSEPALVITCGKERTLVIADTHIGIEIELLKAGFRLPPQGRKISDNLLKICRQVKPVKLVHIGDLKHNIPSAFSSERFAVRMFIDIALSAGGIEHIDIVPGNHDGNLSDMLSDYIESGKVVIHGPGSFSLGDIGFFHGHTWPSDEVVSKSTIVMAHLHPAMRLVDTLGGGNTEMCWVRGRVNPGPATARYPRVKFNRKREVIVLPAFNELCGSALSCSRALGPFLRNDLMSIGSAEIYLLDGTSLGKLRDLPGSRMESTCIKRRFSRKKI
jgi:putative SbcD/Mre11-related phosphoesterase